MKYSGLDGIWIDADAPVWVLIDCFLRFRESYIHEGDGVAKSAVITVYVGAQ